MSRCYSLVECRLPPEGRLHSSGHTSLVHYVLSQGQGQRQSYTDSPGVGDESRGCRRSKLIAHEAIKTTSSTIRGKQQRFPKWTCNMASSVPHMLQGISNSVGHSPRSLQHGDLASACHWSAASDCHYEWPVQHPCYPAPQFQCISCGSLCPCMLACIRSSSCCPSSGRSSWH